MEKLFTYFGKAQIWGGCYFTKIRIFPLFTWCLIWFSNCSSVLSTATKAAFGNKAFICWGCESQIIFSRDVLVTHKD